MIHSPGEEEPLTPTETAEEAETTPIDEAWVTYDPLPAHHETGLTERRWWVLSICMTVLGVIALTIGLLLQDSPASADDSRLLSSYPAVMPTATISTKVNHGEDGVYDSPILGLSFTYPSEWKHVRGTDGDPASYLYAPDDELIVSFTRYAINVDGMFEEAASQLMAATTWITDVVPIITGDLLLAGGEPAWQSEFDGTLEDGETLRFKLLFTEQEGGTFVFFFSAYPEEFELYRDDVEEVISSINLYMPNEYGLPRDETIVLQTGESSNARSYDPATSTGDDLVFSGLVMFDQQLQVRPDLASWWEVSDDGTIYTFHLHPHALFHNGRPVTAHDVIYSWERAASPATGSNLVLTYLGDIVGLREMHAGQTEHINGLKALDAHTLQVTIDAPKPYFLMKLTYSVAYVVDQSNIESGPNWYRTPNGTGPYRMVRWDDVALMYERFDDFYGDLPAIRYHVASLYAGDNMSLYETGAIDITGVAPFNIERVLSPDEPLHHDLVREVGMCTSYVTFDLDQPPFDDLNVRQAFAMSVDKRQYIDSVTQGAGIVAHGLYPMALPGYSSDFDGLEYDPERARQLLAESSYGGPDGLPPIVFTSYGFGSDVSPDVAALIEMWEQNLGVKIEVQNLEPDRAEDELHAGNHGQLLTYGWCADYPDPENFADVLFHSGAQQNMSHYSNPILDALLEDARIEPDAGKRLDMYKQAEAIIVNDAPALFLSHSVDYVLIKPYLIGYVPTPVRVPLIRYLSIDATKLE